PRMKLSLFSRFSRGRQPAVDRGKQRQLSRQILTAAQADGPSWLEQAAGHLQAAEAKDWIEHQRQHGDHENGSAVTKLIAQVVQPAAQAPPTDRDVQRRVQERAKEITERIRATHGLLSEAEFQALLGEDDDA